MAYVFSNGEAGTGSSLPTVAPDPVWTVINPESPPWKRKSYEEPLQGDHAIVVSIKKAIIRSDEKAKQWAEYHIEVKAPWGTFEVPRRYSEFHALASVLRDRFDVHIAFPGKKWLGNLDPEFIETRRRDLEKYLQQLNQELFTKSTDLKNFLDPRQAHFFPVSKSMFANGIPSLDCIGTLRVKIHGAKNLQPAIGKKGPSYDYMCCFFLDKERGLSQLGSGNEEIVMKTKSIKGTPNPEWNYTKLIPVTTLQQRIVFNIRNGRILVGTCTYNLHSLTSKPEYLWLPVYDLSDKDTGGAIRVQLSFVEKEEANKDHKVKTAYTFKTEL